MNLLNKNLIKLTHFNMTCTNCNANFSKFDFQNKCNLTSDECSKNCFDTCSEICTVCGFDNSERADLEREQETAEIYETYYSLNQ